MPGDKKVTIKELDTQEGARLHEIRQELKAEGKIPAPARKDGEQPLAKFEAKKVQIDAGLVVLQEPAPKEPVLAQASAPVATVASKKSTAMKVLWHTFLGSLPLISIVSWICIFGFPLASPFACWMLIVGSGVAAGIAGVPLVKAGTAHNAQKLLEENANWLSMSEERIQAYTLGYKSKDYLPYAKSFLSASNWKLTMNEEEFTKEAYALGLHDAMSDTAPRIPLVV